MKYGFFDDASMEYVIERPDTPLPWINYLGTNGFFRLISNTGGGYCFYKDAKLLRITRYRYNNVPYDNNGHYFYIKEGDSVWNPSWQPVKTPLDFYQCRHGLGYSRFTGEKNGLEAQVLCFVPTEDPCQIQKVTLTNRSSEKKNFQLFSYVEWCLWNADDDSRNFQRNLSTGEVEIEGSAIYHKTEYRERRNHYAFYSVNAPVSHFDTSRDAFLGVYQGPEAPKAVLAGALTDSVASGWYPIAAHQLDLCLEPGERKTFIFVLGYAENPQEEKWEATNVVNKAKARKLLEKYGDEKTVDQAFEELCRYWKELLSNFQAASSDDKVNRMVNIWNQYQCMVTFNMSRSASYYESGIGRGMGFRDSCQDLLGFLHLIPERARDRIIDIASTQFPDGSAYHQYQPLTKKGNSDIGSGFNDDPLWLIAAVNAYIRETGDLSILEEQVPFDNDMSTAVPLMEHLKRSFDFIAAHKGPHGLPLIGRADWNDCLNLGEISSYPPGYKENGGIFCHNNPWVSISEAIVGRGERAFEVYQKICPAFLEEISEVHRTEPYVYSQMVAGKDAPNFGEAKNSWLTGTAAWTFVNISQYILGIQPTLQGLKIDPCIPGDFGDFTVTRKYRGVTYHIQVSNPDHVEKGVASMTVDGTAVKGNLIPFSKEKDQVEVKVIMG
ncbi:GH36-type glycosyl hydrolase domain-containing protein [Blautia sp. An46]|uniref:GH36-type glycosyl hydrolase domain-containing protein n=1 Tax=Blautia sp. An46 TaxID=1965636 RepID=UPI000B3AA1D0|nr:hypothetical protein [Blautia sp. An46]OUN93117.1 hypothetical protein B5G00_06230 [Blautia sp. An46]